MISKAAKVQCVISSDPLFPLVPVSNSGYFHLYYCYVTDAAASGDLQTDGDIGKSTKLGAAELQSLQGRDLASVDSSWLSSDAMGSLEGGGKSKKGGNTSWDQFEVNKRLYNVNSSYDENLYTKPLNRNELTRDQIKKADKYAKEIEGTRSSNVHLQEERGQVMERDMDEEDLYSGVLRPAAAPSPTAKAPKAASSSSSGGSWRRAVTGEPSSPTTVPTSAAPPGLSKGNKPCPMAGGNVKAKNAGKGKSGPARVASPPAYDDDFIPVPSNAEGARKSPPATAAATAPKSQQPDASGGKGTQEKRAESPDISFFAVPEEKPPPALGKGEEPKTEKKEPVTAEVSADKKDLAPAVAVATSSKLNANAKEFKFNANAKEFVFTPKAATAPATAPVVPAGQAVNPGGKQHGGNRRFDSHGGNQGYQSHGYPENGYGGPPQQWAHGGSMMYSNGGMMMNGPIVPPVGEMPMMGGYPIYPDMGYGGGGPMMGHVPGQMYPNAPPMHMGPGGYDPSYGGAGPHMGGRGGGRGGYGGGRGGRGNYNAGGAHGTGQQGDGAARGRYESSQSCSY